MQGWNFREEILLLLNLYNNTLPASVSPLSSVGPSPTLRARYDGNKCDHGPCPHLGGSVVTVIRSAHQKLCNGAHNGGGHTGQGR